MLSRIELKIILMGVGLFLPFSADATVDSYRFLHVSISTPWYLFIFLLGGVFSPFILMAVLAWYSAMRKARREAEDSNSKPHMK